MSTNVPPIQFTPNGIVLPTEAQVLAGIQADINSAFGGNVNPDPTTPQGQLAVSESAIINDKNAQIAYIVNQVDPQYATGRMQDAIGHIYFMDRLPALPTTVVCTLIGSASTPIPLGTKAQAQDGNIYISTQDAEIPSGGSVSVPFQCLTDGPITCPAGSLNIVYQAINGWDAITNPADGIIGRDIETTSQFEYRRQQSVAANAKGSLPSIYAALFDPNQCPGVIDVYCLDNPTDSPVTIGAQTLAPHSLWACVAGGTASQIAAAIWKKKSIGCNYNGDNPTVVYDTSGYNAPYPQYTVNWWTATPTPIKFAISIANTPYLPANVVALVQNAIIAAFAGLDNGPVARIGSTLYASRYYAPVIAVATAGTVIEILSLQLGISVANLSAVTMGIDQIPTISAGNIGVTLV